MGNYFPISLFVGVVAMSNTKVLLLCWVVLVLATMMTVYFGASGYSMVAQISAILFVAMVKSGLIIDGFMELRHTAGRWRLLMYGWPLAMCLIIATTLLLPSLG